MQGNYVSGIRYKGRLLKDLELSIGRGFDFDVLNLRKASKGYWCYTADAGWLVRIDEIEIREVGAMEWEPISGVLERYKVDKWLDGSGVYYLAEVDSDIVLGLRSLGIELYGTGFNARFVPGVWFGHGLVVKYGDEKSYLEGLYYYVNSITIKDMRALGRDVLKYIRDFITFVECWVVADVDAKDFDGVKGIDLIEYKGFSLITTKGCQLSEFKQGNLDRYLEVCKKCKETM